MSDLKNEPLTLEHDQARILFRHWQGAQTVEGFVREFSPDGTHVRISATPKKKEQGAWFPVRTLRVEQVLEKPFDFAAWQREEAAERKRRRNEDEGEDWRNGE